MAKTSKAAKPAKKAAKKAAARRPRQTPADPKRAHVAREHLPIPDPKHVGLTTYDAKDPNTNTRRSRRCGRRRARPTC